MNNYLDYKKNQVRYWSEIGALTLTLTPIFIKLLTKEVPWNKGDWKGLSLKEKLFILGFLIVFGIITYYAYYYTISSMFWPEPLSLLNWILLIPCGIMTFFEVKENIQPLIN